VKDCINRHQDSARRSAQRISPSWSVKR
jgi:hypothetical protein